ncbi:MAG: stage III sporulation AC/AD family protein [Oscillospiraceae bacterium]|nr:stage III sporulation AC/AD family protein [Oscillospiraceae bacterium]
MDLLFKLCGVLLVSGCAAMMIRKSNPEMALSLSASALTAVFGAALTLLRPMREMWEKAQTLYGVEDVYLLPLFKCCAAALVARLTADLCREASQNAAAAAAELLGVICALGAAMPLIGTMLGAIGEML